MGDLPIFSVLYSLCFLFPPYRPCFLSFHFQFLSPETLQQSKSVGNSKISKRQFAFDSKLEKNIDFIDYLPPVHLACIFFMMSKPVNHVQIIFGDENVFLMIKSCCHSQLSVQYMLRFPCKVTSYCFIMPTDTFEKMWLSMTLY